MDRTGLIKMQLALRLFLLIGKACWDADILYQILVTIAA